VLAGWFCRPDKKGPFRQLALPSGALNVTTAAGENHERRRNRLREHRKAGARHAKPKGARKAHEKVRPTKKTKPGQAGCSASRKDDVRKKARYVALAEPTFGKVVSTLHRVDESQFPSPILLT
jgi:hypothetical protein